MDINEITKDNKKDNSYEEIDKDEKLKKETEEFICPESSNKSIRPTGVCGICLQCGYSKCN